MQQYRQRQPLGFSGFNSTTSGDTPKAYSKPPLNRNHSTRGFEVAAGDMEEILERERKVLRETQQKTETTLDREKKHRIELQGKLLKAKQEVSRRDRDLGEVRYKLESVLQENRNIVLENEHLRRDLESARQAYEYKLQELQMKLNEEEGNRRIAAQRYTEEYESFRQEGQDYIEVLTFQHDRQRKSLEDSVRRLEQRNTDLLADNKRLNDQLADQQLSYEEQIRGNINRVREEEQRKYNSSLLAMEQKLKTSEGFRQSLSKKNQELNRQLQEKDNSLACMGVDRTEECVALKQEVFALKERSTQLKLALDRVTSELADKDEIIARKTCSTQAQTVQLRQKLDQYKRQVDDLNDTIRSLKQQARDTAASNQRRHQQLLERCSYHQSQCQRYRNESLNTWQHLKSKLSQTIESIHH